MHKPLRRIVPGAKQAVLFVHGIVSTPRFFDDFIALVPPAWSVHSLLLPGHGGSVRDFGNHGAAEWTAHVQASLDELRQTHEKVFIVAHSLGTLLSIRQAVQNDARIAGMLLLCVPLRIRVKPQAVVHNILKGVGLTQEADLHTYYSIAQDWRAWRYLGWIPRYIELFRESAAVRREFSRLKAPAVVFMAQQDELVSLRGEKLLRENPGMDVRLLPGSHHHDFPPEDKALLLEAFREMCGF